MSKIKLGDKVRDKVTGFEGIATSRVEYINKCVQFCVKPKMGKDNKMPDGEYIDIDQLEVVGEGVLIESEPTGGPQRDCPRH